MPKRSLPESRRLSKRGRLVGSILLATTAVPLSAQAGPDDPDSSSNPNDIVITGQRVADVTPERRVDSEEVSSYGLGTVGEVLDEIMAEAGEGEDPVVLVNGERVSDLADVADYPAEAIARVDVLPRGTGVRVGASAQRRVYNVVLRKQVRTLTTALAYRAATDGGWSSRRGEATFTRIRGPNRLNVLFRIRDEDDLLESDRHIIQPGLTVPYDLRGNLIPDPRVATTEIDPILSALAGRIVTRAGVPPGTNPGLGDFLATADRINLTDLGDYRTLRPRTDDYDLTLSAGNRLAPWLTSSVNARVNYSRSRSLLGLPSGTFILPETSPFSPFSGDVGLARYGSDPLEQRYRSLSGNVNASLNANLGRWQIYLASNYSHGDRRYTTDRQNFSLGSGPIVVVDPGLNPFAGSLDDLLPILASESRSISNNGGAQLRVTGTPVKLPAGPARLTLGAGLTFSELIARNSSLAAQPERRFHRTERNLSASAQLPLASRRNSFLPALGELSAILEYGLADISDVGTLSRYSVGVSWEPRPWIRLFGSIGETKPAPDVQRVAESVVVTPGVRYFDALSGETVDVTQISGGNPNLLGQIIRTRRFAVNAAPMPRINLQLNAEYSSTANRNLISGLPPASEAIVLAFPERFVRDSNGVLTTVDVRPVNFVRQAQEQLRYGFSFTIPLGGVRPAARADPSGDVAADAEDDGPAPPPPPAAIGSRPRFQLLAYHTFVLSDEVLIRPGLAPIDLLGGGAIGLGGGRSRHQFEMTLGVSDRGIGARLTGLWRGESFLNIRTGGTPSTLRFSPLATVALRAFAEGRRLFPKAEWAKGSRFSLSIANLANRRQNVRDSAGATPLRYQPGYRDPLGRTIELEARKVF